MNTFCKMLMGLTLAATLANGMGCDQLPEVTIVVGGDNAANNESPEPEAPESPAEDDDFGENDRPDAGNPPPETDDEPQTDAIASQIEDQLAGMRITYLSSDGNGQSYSSYHEVTDLCSSGEFAYRSVSQFAGYGYGSEDIFESTGTWNIIEMDGQLMLNTTTLQSSTGFTGSGQVPVELRADGSVAVGRGGFFVTDENTTCN